MIEQVSARVGIVRVLLTGLLFGAALLGNPSRAAVLGPDFDGDGKADLVWHHGSTGASFIWYMNGAALTGAAGLFPYGGDWRETHFADFNADGKSDIVWRNVVTGETALWLMNGGTIVAGTGLLSDPNWEVTHTGDLNGDGKADILWRNTDGSTAVWLMDGIQLIGGGGLVADPNWRITHVADMNGDGKDDILWRNQVTGESVIWFMNGASFAGSAPLVTNTSLYVTHVGDFNGDGKKDIVFRNSATGQTIIWLLNNGVFAGGGPVMTDPNWVVTHVADFDGDGKSDLLWRNSVTGETVIWRMNGATFAGGGVIMSDAAWKVTHVLDLNGDGKADLVWYNQDTGATAVWLMNGASYSGGAALLSDRWWQQTLVGDTSNPLGYLVTDAERSAMRFLTQATMGPNDAAYQHLRGMNLDLWLYEQFITPVLSSHVIWLNTALGTQLAKTPPGTISVDDFMESWWTQAITGADQLRQRATFALSQLFVISTNDAVLGSQPYAFGAYHDMLAYDVYGNFRQILKDVTLSPAMGMYLNMTQSQKQNANATQLPNENYAREINQLFSIGLYLLNDDGTLQLDNLGQPQPTYDQSVVQGYARAFTGWSWGGAPAGWVTQAGVCPVVDNTINNQFFNPPNVNTRPDCYYPFSLKPWQAYHETGNKQLLNGQILSSAASPTQVTTDMDAAIDSIYYHQNVPPFVCKALIQRLVTSNPSPGYIARCSAVFKNDGSGGAITRGNMRAVWRAILLDPEARSMGMIRDTQYGKAREPMLRMNTIIRALNGKATSNRYRFTDTSSPENALGESPYRAPTVFNFYDPAYVPDGGFTIAGKVAPELQILTTTSAVGANNYLNGLVYNGLNGVGAAAADRVNLDYSTLLPYATKTAVLVDRMNFLFLNGRMSPALRTQINKALEAMPSATAANQLDRVKAAVYLTTFGPEFTIQK